MLELFIYSYLAIGSLIYAALAYSHHIGEMPAPLSIRFEMNQMAFMVACILVSPLILPFAIFKYLRGDFDD